MSFNVSLEGFDEMENKLNQMQKSAERLSNTKELSFGEVFTSEFMQKYTDVTSIDELIDNAGYAEQDFESIPDKPWDKYVNEHTKFPNWQEMMDQATLDHVAKKLGFN